MEPAGCKASIHHDSPGEEAAGMILFLAVINSFKVFRGRHISWPDLIQTTGIYLLQHLFNHWF